MSPRRWGTRIRRIDRAAVASVAAALALVVGVGSAVLSAYWALGGQALLTTVGGTFQQAGRCGGALARAGPWLVVAGKATVAALPLTALRPPRRAGRSRVIPVLAWAAAGGLTAYGFVRTTAAMLAELVLDLAGLRADPTLAWHAFVWDPWLLLWGLLAGVAMLTSRPARAASAVADG